MVPAGGGEFRKGQPPAAQALQREVNAAHPRLLAEARRALVPALRGNYNCSLCKKRGDEGQPKVKCRCKELFPEGNASKHDAEVWAIAAAEELPYSDAYRRWQARKKEQDDEDARRRGEQLRGAMQANKVRPLRRCFNVSRWRSWLGMGRRTWVGGARGRDHRRRSQDLGPYREGQEMRVTVVNYLQCYQCHRWREVEDKKLFADIGKKGKQFFCHMVGSGCGNVCDSCHHSPCTCLKTM